MDHLILWLGMEDWITCKFVFAFLSLFIISSCEYMYFFNSLINANSSDPPFSPPPSAHPVEKNYNAVTKDWKWDKQPLLFTPFLSIIVDDLGKDFGILVKDVSSCSKWFQVKYFRENESEHPSLINVPHVNLWHWNCLGCICDFYWQLCLKLARTTCYYCFVGVTNNNHSVFPIYFPTLWLLWLYMYIGY